jgi:S1-C subfamily serine protease
VFIRILTFLLASVWIAGAVPAEPEKSVIQIITFGQQPIWDAPWRFDSVRKGTGSGFVIKGKRIMTNAHVVSWARQILVKRYQDPATYVARVAFIGHDCDLAVLEVQDESFFDGLEPLALGELPKVRSTVTTFGYPAGGEQISYTRGVVSRIEVKNYVHIGNRAFVVVQTDAAINPGNSGGPVILDGEVVGVAFQGIMGLENTGFFIPTPVVEHFLKDIEDGTYHGFPQAGLRVVPLQNPAYRRMLKLPNNGIGARIDSILPIPSTERLLKENDVLLRVGDYDVGSDGTILFEGNRVSAGVAFNSAQHGESLSLKIWREGQEVEVLLPLYVYEKDRAVGNQYDVLPRYFVYGGLVFTPLSMDYMKTVRGNLSEGGNAELAYELYYRRNESPETARSEPVVLATILAHPVNANMGIQGRALVDRVNGIHIDKLEDLIHAFESEGNPHHVIQFVPHASIQAINKTEADAVNLEILRTYNILHDRRL